MVVLSLVFVLAVWILYSARKLGSTRSSKEQHPSHEEKRRDTDVIDVLASASFPSNPVAFAIAARPASEPGLKRSRKMAAPDIQWKRVVTLDVETTGLHTRDRIVTLAMVLLDVATFESGKVQLKVIHRIYNPGIACHPAATRIHGHSDWALRHQPFFLEEAQEIVDFISTAEVVICHNAEFDLRFLNRELTAAGLAALSIPSYCTMEAYRSRYEGSAQLDSVIKIIGMKRDGGVHGALEDAWLTMNVFLKLHGAGAVIPFTVLSEEHRALQNWKGCPPIPVGALPPRKRRPRVAPARAR
jgi:DNA polymerase-3 subunit epsilon